MITVQVLQHSEINYESDSISCHPGQHRAWLRILHQGLGHRPYLLQALHEGQLVGELPLVLVSGPLFGKFLVSLSYLNTGGVRATSTDVQSHLIKRAISLSDELNCRHLELRHESPIESHLFNAELSSKVNMRLKLPDTIEELRRSLKAKVRNQVKKGEQQDFSVHWGRDELVDDFYQVFAIRMRELGTPVYSRKLFISILKELSSFAEICSVRKDGKVAAAALLVHGRTTTEVPSAANLVRYNRLNVNMFMYWQLLSRAVERGQLIFDFGRATLDGPTFKFKKQWGAQSEPAHWQYYIRQGSVEDMRPDSGKKKILIESWKRLPVWMTKLLGPPIVRGIP